LRRLCAGGILMARTKRTVTSPAVMADRSPPKISANTLGSPAKGGSGAFADRRAQALRDNLLKRKSQARARAEADRADGGKSSKD
jgi:hypothetical protein